jgi:Cu-Zn family superoxide dismutase
MRVTVALAALALAGCQGMQSQAEAPRATAQLKPTQGNKAIGEVSFEQTRDGVRVFAIVNHLTPGSHGFHIHETGDCSAPDATSAGGHFNPTGQPHGSPAGGPHHAGDLPMLVADKKGKAKLDATLAGLTVAPGPSSIVGRAVVVHAAPDDYRSQPAGNSGARVACGVIQPG